MVGAYRRGKEPIVTFLRKKGPGKTTHGAALKTKAQTGSSGSSEDDPYAFDIGFTDDVPVGDLQESQEAGGQSDEPRISQDAAKFDKPAAQPPCLKQQTAQHEPGFLQRLVAKQESHAVAWTDSESGAELGGDAKKGYANGSIQPMHLKATQQQDDSGAPTAPAEDQQANNVQSRKMFQSSKDSQDKQAQAFRPSARSVGSQDSDRPRRGALPKRPLSAASQGSTGSRKRKAEPSSAMDEPGRGKKIGQNGVHRLAWLGTSPAKRVTSADTLDTSVGTAKGPTVMEAQESGEQFQLQDDIQYALDGLCASALPSDRACSAAKLAEMAATRRGRLALRAGGLFQDVMGAASTLHLNREPLTALAIAIMLLAFAKDRVEQAALRQDSALTVLKKLLQSQQDANVKTGDSRTLQARTSLARILKDPQFAANVPIAHRLSPCSLATAALAGALDPQQASPASEELKMALLQQGVMQALTELASDCAERVSAAPKGDAARPLWDLHRCLLTLEYATFACPANEQALVNIRLAAPAQQSSSQAKQEQHSAPSRRAAAALSASERGNDPEPEAAPPMKHLSAPEISCSPPNGRMASMQLSQEDSQSTQERRPSEQISSQPSMQEQQNCSSAGAQDLAADSQLFPAWLTQQVTALFLSSTGAPSRGLRRDCLQCMLSVLMNLTHNNAAGTAAVVAAGGLEAAAHVVDSVLGPPEEEAFFVRIADRRRLLEGLDLVSTTLGLLINLAEQDKACQPILAGLSLPHGKVVVPLLCRLMQAGGKQPGSKSPRKSPRKSGSPGLEVTEEQLVAGEEEGAASIVEVYAALLLGFVTESDLAQQKVVDMHLEGGMATVTAAVKQCLQFYVNANAITAKTEASLRALIASLGGSNEQES